LDPPDELGFYGIDDRLECREVAIMQAQPPHKLPETLDGIELRTVGREKIQGEALGALLPPVLVEDGVMVPGIVCDGDHAVTALGAEMPEISHELPKRHGVEPLFLPTEGELPVTQADGAEVANALPAGMMQHDRIRCFGWHPHAAL